MSAGKLRVEEPCFCGCDARIWSISERGQPRRWVIACMGDDCDHEVVADSQTDALLDWHQLVVNLRAAAL